MSGLAGDHRKRVVAEEDAQKRDRRESLGRLNKTVRKGLLLSDSVSSSTVRAAQGRGEIERAQSIVKRPHIFAPITSATPMRRPLVWRSGMSGVNQLDVSDVFVPASSVVSDISDGFHTRSITIPALAITSRIIESAQNAFRAGRFERVVVGGVEQAESRFMIETTFHVEDPGYYDEIGIFDFRLLGVSGGINSVRSTEDHTPAMRSGKYVIRNSNINTSGRTETEESGSSDHRSTFIRFIQRDPKGQNYSNFGRTKIHDTINGMFVIKVRWHYVCRTTVTEKAGAEIVGTGERVVEQSLNTIVSSYSGGFLRVF